MTCRAAALLLIVAPACTAQDPADHIDPVDTVRYEGRTWIDGEPVDAGAQHAIVTVTRMSGEAEGCSDVWKLYLEFGRADDSTSTWSNIFALEPLDVGMSIPLQDVGSSRVTGHKTPLLIMENSANNPLLRAMDGGEMRVDVWTPEHGELRYTGGQWCERQEGVTDWSCESNPHEVVVEWDRIQTGLGDTLENPGCTPTGLPVQDWIEVEGSGTLCTPLTGSCHDYW